MKYPCLILFLSLLFPLFTVKSQELVSKEELIADITYLASDELGGRGTGSEGNVKARVFIAERFKELGMKPLFDDFFQPFNFKARLVKETAGVNVIGVIEGESPQKIIITAHYDHLGIKGDQIFNGADDDASGVAGILAIARYYSRHKPKNTLVFIAFDAEEKGLQGSKYFVRNLPFKKKEVIVNINLDMVGRDDHDRIYAAGGSHYPELVPIIEKVQKEAPVTIVMGNDQPSDGHNDWTMSSDHGPFHQKGIPFIYFGVEDHPDYHKATDTADKINPTFYQNTVQTILQTVQAIDQTTD
ncbi:MAG: M20/M25/M40 family metallo-hydrolase [Ekhidna sp.]|nr:M20/M25/M40 family metallo-hydrolase [Ekhidna sp.]